MVNNAIHMLNTHFVNPFDPSLASDKLYVVSGAPVCFNISNCLLNSQKNGMLRKLEFDSRMVPGEPSKMFSTRRYLALSLKIVV